ncbi:nitrile hydratase subunit alpha [Pelagibius sp. Alg239-R121]|uniref:nitrile hydratase subunit alpha n=1 Tax=Pelagibius sp. Alg239-R121 TaxID=2993448 RepID=UPI0024A75FFA|nr:nitrile hydratase subunit alpha [Pelagibius sp. Alg239-R121]
MTEYNAKDAEHLHPLIHSHVPSEPALRVKALETLLVEKGLLDSAAVDAWVEVYSDEIGPKVGAAVVARAWCDDGFRERLLADGATAIGELGIQGWAPNHLKVVENTESVHNLVVCTLCSCYPHRLLGIQPAWYKLEAYRSRAVRDPRGVLAEFEVSIPETVRVDVWDSTAELRYFVLPQRPEGSEDMDEQALAALVSRNSMIGTQRDLPIETGGA